MEFQKIGVVGGGTMGAGIIQSLSAAGYEVIFKELEQALVQHCLNRIEKIFESSIKKGMISEDEARVKIRSIKVATDYGIFADAELVIEAVPEVIDFKREVFRKLGKVCSPDAILATNTSSLSISELGGISQRPEKVVGIHWF